MSMALFACITMALTMSATAGLSSTIKVGSLQAVVSTPTKGTQASIDTVKAANLAHLAALITPQAAGVQLIVTQELGEYHTFRRGTGLHAFIQSPAGLAGLVFSLSHSANTIQPDAARMCTAYLSSLNSSLTLAPLLLTRNALQPSLLTIPFLPPSRPPSRLGPH